MENLISTILLIKSLVGLVISINIGSRNLDLFIKAIRESKDEWEFQEKVLLCTGLALLSIKILGLIILIAGYLSIRKRERVSRVDLIQI